VRVLVDDRRVGLPLKHAGRGEHPSLVPKTRTNSAFGRRDPLRSERIPGRRDVFARFGHWVSWSKAPFRYDKISFRYFSSRRLKCAAPVTKKLLACSYRKRQPEAGVCRRLALPCKERQRSPFRFSLDLSPRIRANAREAARQVAWKRAREVGALQNKAQFEGLGLSSLRSHLSPPIERRVRHVRGAS